MERCRYNDNRDPARLAEGHCPDCGKPLVVEDGWGHCPDNPRVSRRMRNGREEHTTRRDRGRNWRYPN